MKSLSLAAERRLRGGRAKMRLPSIDESIWLDFDFAVVGSLPQSDPFLAAFLGQIQPKHVVYDVGSFVGCYAVPAARRVVEGRVIAFEPVPESAKLLRRHCHLNGVEDKVRVVEAACSNAAGVSGMSVWPALSTTWASGNALRNVYPRESVQPVRTPVCTLRLDDFVLSGGPAPDIIKIDVEGADVWVLEGATHVLETFRPMVFLEIHSFAWSLFETTEDRLKDLLAKVRYNLCAIEKPYDALKAIPDYGHALLLPRPQEG